MLRILTLLVALLAAPPALAQSRENIAANTIFVQAMRDLHTAQAMEIPPLWTALQARSDAASRKHAALVAVKQKLGLLIERYPGSDLAVQLITGQRIGGFSAELLEREISAIRNAILTPQEIERIEQEVAARQAPPPARHPPFDTDALLRTLRPTPQQVAPTAPLRPLSEEEVGALHRQVEDRWALDPGARGIESFVVDIRVTLDASGAVKSAEIVKSQGAPADSLNAFAQGARRAVFSASPLRIPQGRVLDGHLILTFRGAAMRRD